MSITASPRTAIATLLAVKNMKSSRFNVLQLSGLSPTTLQAHPLGWVARWQTVADDNPRSLASSKSSMPSQDLTAAALATLANAA